MMTLMPSAASAFSASGVDAFTGSAMANSPASLPSTAMLMTVAPSPRRRSPCSFNDCGIDAERLQEVRIAEHDGLAVDLAGRALAGRRVEFFHLAEIEIALLGRPHDGVGQRMFARPLDARRQPQNFGLVKSLAGTMATTFGLPSVSVPVLSTTSVSIFSMRSSASAFLISTPACAPRPTPTMIDIGVARPSAQGQAMMSTLTAATRPNAMRGSGPNQAQAPNAISATAMTTGTNQPAT